jgi:outer membrane biosynthesis protein TonB
VEVALYNLYSFLWELETGKPYQLTKAHDIYSGLGKEYKKIQNIEIEDLLKDPEEETEKEEEEKKEEVKEETEEKKEEKEVKKESNEVEGKEKESEKQETLPVKEKTEKTSKATDLETGIVFFNHSSDVCFIVHYFSIRNAINRTSAGDHE